MASCDGTFRRPRGEALEPRLYLDPELLEAEQERIFERTWQLIGHVSALPRPGSYTTGFAGDQPVLVVRDEERPRCAPTATCAATAASCLLSGSGQCKGAIRCRYHGWTYRFDGTLIGVPEGLQFGERLDKSALGLMPVRVEELCGLVFVNLDPDAAPLAELVGDLPARLAPLPDRDARVVRARRRHQPANWKVVAENYLEGYHIPIAHPGLMRMLDYKHYDTELHEHYAWIEAPMRAKPRSNRLERLYGQLVTPMPGLGEEDRRTWRYVFIYPNTTIDLYPDQVNTWQMLPDGLARTRDVSASLPRAPARAAHARRPVDQPAPEHARARRGHRPGAERPARAADARLPVRPAVAPGERGRLVRRPDPRRPRRRARERPRRRVEPRANGSSPRRSARSPPRGSTACGSPASPWRRACRPRSSTTTSLPATRCWRRRSTTPTCTPARRGSRAETSCPGPRTPSRLQSMIEAVPAHHAESLRRTGCCGSSCGCGRCAIPSCGRSAEELYARLHAWFAREIAEGVKDGEFARCDPDEVADRAMALIDGYGMRTLIGDPAIPLERARRAVSAALARELGLDGEQLVERAA